MDESRIKHGGKLSPEIVHYSSKRKLLSNKKIIKSNNDVKEESSEKEKVLTFDMRKARMDVFKFGISGLDETAKVDAKTAHAIKLGAKPRKNKSINYKVLLEEKKREKEQERQLREESARYKLENPFKSKPIKGKKRKKDVNDVGKLNCQPGIYKNGVQVIKKSKLFSK